MNPRSLSSAKDLAIRSFWPIAGAIAILIGVSASVAQELDPPTEEPIATSTEESPERKQRGATPIGGFREVTVTATRFAANRFEVPRATEILTGDRLIGEISSRSLPEALQETPGVFVQRTGPGQASPFIRGFTGFRVLHLIDGIRLNNAVFREGPNQYFGTVDIFSIDRLELVRGPGSVLYGTDAVGGVINVLVRKRVPKPEEPTSFERRLRYRFASADSSSQLRAEMEGVVNGKLGFILGATTKSFGDIEGGRHTGLQRGTGYTELDGDARFDLIVSDATRLVFGFQHVDQDNVPRTHSTIDGITYRGAAPGSDLRRNLNENRDLVYGMLRSEDLAGPVDSFEIGLSYQRQAERRERVRGDGRRDIQGFEDETIGIFGRAVSELEWGRLTLGADYYRDFVNSSRKDFAADGSFSGHSIQGPVGDDASYDLAGVYFQGEVDLGEVAVLTLGARGSFSAARASSVEDPRTGQKISIRDRSFSVVGNGAIRVDLAEGWNVYASVAQSFRAPNLSDLTRFDSARSGEIETPVEGLRPERFVSYEIGVKASTDRLYGQASYFFTDIRSLITRFETGNVIDGDREVTKGNVGDGKVQGVEVSGEVDLVDGWSVFSGLTWVAGETKVLPAAGAPPRDDPLSRLQPVTSVVGVRWDQTDGRFWFEGRARIVRHQNRLSARDELDTQRIPVGGTPGYTVYSLRGGVRLQPGVRLFAGIENLFDRDYRIHGSGLNEAGTNVILGIDWTF